MRGYRLFRMARDGLGPVVNRQHTLHGNGEPAVCTNHLSNYDKPDDYYSHDAPQEFCTCGYYAYYSREQLEILGDNRSAVAVEVEGYGTLRLHDSGFRAQYQDIVAVEWPTCFNCERPTTVVGEFVAYCGACEGAQNRQYSRSLREQGFRPVLEYLNVLVTRYGCEIKEAYKPSWTSVDTSEQSPNQPLNAAAQTAASLNALASQFLNIAPGVTKTANIPLPLPYPTRKPYRLSHAAWMLAYLLISCVLWQAAELLLLRGEVLWLPGLMLYAIFFYVYCGVVAYGLTSAYFRCRPFPADPLPTAIPTAVLGPIGLAVAYLLGDHGEYGLMYP